MTALVVCLGVFMSSCLHTSTTVYMTREACLKAAAQYGDRAHCRPARSILSSDER